MRRVLAGGACPSGEFRSLATRGQAPHVFERCLPGSVGPLVLLARIGNGHPQVRYRSLRTGLGGHGLRSRLIRQSIEDLAILSPPVVNNLTDLCTGSLRRPELEEIDVAAAGQALRQLDQGETESQLVVWQDRGSS